MTKSAADRLSAVEAAHSAGIVHTKSTPPVDRESSTVEVSIDRSSSNESGASKVKRRGGLEPVASHSQRDAAPEKIEPETELEDAMLMGSMLHSGFEVHVKDHEAGEKRLEVLYTDIRFNSVFLGRSKGGTDSKSVAWQRVAGVKIGKPCHTTNDESAVFIAHENGGYNFYVGSVRARDLMVLKLRHFIGYLKREGGPNLYEKMLAAGKISGKTRAMVNKSSYCNCNKRQATRLCLFSLMTMFVVLQFVFMMVHLIMPTDAVASLEFSADESMVGSEPEESIISREEHFAEELLEDVFGGKKTPETWSRRLTPPVVIPDSARYLFRFCTRVLCSSISVAGILLITWEITLVVTKAFAQRYELTY